MAQQVAPPALPADATEVLSGANPATYDLPGGPLVTDTDGATVTFDLSVSNVHQVTLGGNRTLALSNAKVGQRFLIKLIQDGTGSRTVTWFTTLKWPSGVVPTLTTTASKGDWFSFICTSAGNYDGFVAGQNY